MGSDAVYIGGVFNTLAAGLPPDLSRRQDTPPAPPSSPLSFLIIICHFKSSFIFLFFFNFAFALSRRRSRRGLANVNDEGDVVCWCCVMGVCGARKQVASACGWSSGD
jgi:hypothetical protein